MNVKEFSTPEAADSLGITPAQFRRLAKKRQLIPSGYYTNPHYRSGPECPKWSAKDLGRLKRTKDLQSIYNRATPDPESAKRKRLGRLRRKYPTLEPLLVDACTALFNLNRYAKWPNCTPANREEIYKLKSDLISLLCKRGLADRIYLHKQQLPAKPCFRCRGTGEGDWYDEDGRCGKCDGTGIYLDAKELVFVVFSFVVGDDATRFTWHQPRELVTWTFRETNPPDTWEQSELKPIEMKRSKFADAKGLIRYAIGRLKNEEDSA